MICCTYVCKLVFQTTIHIELIFSMFRLQLKGTPMMSVRVTHFSKIYIFLLPSYIVYQNLFCGTLIGPLSIRKLS